MLKCNSNKSQILGKNRHLRVKVSEKLLSRRHFENPLALVLCLGIAFEQRQGHQTLSSPSTISAITTYDRQLSPDSI